MTFEIPFAARNRLTITLVPIFQGMAIILSITFQFFRDAKAVVWALEFSATTDAAPIARLARPQSYKHGPTLAVYGKD